MFNFFKKKIPIELTEEQKSILSTSIINKKRYLYWITHYEADYQRDMEILHSLPPAEECTPEQIELYRKLSARLVDEYAPNFLRCIKR